MAKLSIIIPSLNEPYLDKTIKDIKEHLEGDTEVIPIFDDGSGQRAITNKALKGVDSQYIMKTDAHCSFSQGFDVKMMALMDGRTILAPILMPLDGEQWVINGRKQMKQFVFDSNFVMQHLDGDVGETMCLQGSCFMTEVSNYWAWNLGDETMPSWGGQGSELGIKAFLNGGRCLTTREAYYGHVFRHTDAEFPYDRGLSPGKQATEELKKRYCNKSLKPLIEKFNYPCDWKEKVDELLI